LTKAVAAQTITGLLGADPALESVVQRIAEARPGAPIAVGGAPEGSWGLLAEHLRARLGTSVLVIASDPQALVDDLLAFEGVQRALHYPAGRRPADGSDPAGG